MPKFLTLIAFHFFKNLYQSPVSSLRLYDEEGTSLRASMSMVDANLSQYNLGPLTYNLDEVRTIANMVGGKIITGKDVSEEIFENSVQERSVLHFATHSILNQKNPSLAVPNHLIVA